MSDEHVTLPDDDGEDVGAEGTAADAGESPEALPEPAADAPTSCAECGTPIEPDQQYCLECGAPTPYAVPLRKRGTAGWLVAASLLALGIGGGALIYALTSEDGGTTVASVSTGGTLSTLPPFSVSTNTLPNPFTTTTLPPTGTIPTVPTFTGFTDETDTETDFTDETDTETDTFTDETTTTTPSTTSATTRTTTPTTDTSTGTTDDGDDDWTATTTKWTIILRSFETRADAEDLIDTIQNGAGSAGLIVSDNYTSLNPGYYVVFRGVYDTKAAATAALPAAKKSYPSAYVREITA